MIGSRTKKRLSKLIEIYINDFKKYAVEEIYGKGSVIKIKNIDYITNGKFLAIEAVIILKDTINESSFDRALADYLIQDALVYMYPEKSVKIYVDWDV